MLTDAVHKGSGKMFNNMDTEIFSIEYEANKKEIKLQLAYAFEAFLIDELMSKGKSLDTPINWLKQSDISKKLVLPSIYKEYIRFDHHSKQDFLLPSHYAKKYNLIDINEKTKPYTYTLIPKNKQPKNFQLRPYQESIIKQVSILKESVLIEAPTGAGKSVIASQIAKEEIQRGGTVLIVAPKIILLEQLQETFSELQPQTIHGPDEYDANHHIFISTLQTAHKRKLGFEPSMIIIDEIHYGFSGKMIEQLLREFDDRLIGLSATPYDQNGAPLKGFEHHINKYDLNYMLKNGYLVNPLCYAPVKIDLSSISVIGGDYNQTELDRAFNNQENILRVVRNTKDTVLKREASLVFCINIAHAEAMAQAYNDYGVPAKAIHSKLSINEQEQIMDDYKNGKLKILSNPMMLTTGFDHPATDCIILARATQSQNLYRQMVGRALRLSENKKDAVILDCSNVIDNLGLPTKPIEEKQPKIKTLQICKECEGSTFFKRIENKYKNAFRVCATCGDEQIIEKKGLECEKCGLIANERTRYLTKENTLYMECNKCHHLTIIEKASNQEELEAIFDLVFIKKLQQDITILYIGDLMEKYSPSFAFTPEVSRHVHALQAFIVKKPQEFVGVSSVFRLNRIDDFFQSYKDEGFSGTFFELEKAENWRLFTQKFEDKLLDTNVSVLKDKIESAKNVENLWALINQLNQQQNLEKLPSEIYKELLVDISQSKIDGIESMVVKRIKQLYWQKEQIENIKGFVQMMKEVLG